MLNSRETVDEYCSRVDDELRATEVREPLHVCFEVWVLLSILAWLPILALF